MNLLHSKKFKNLCFALLVLCTLNIATHTSSIYAQNPIIENILSKNSSNEKPSKTQEENSDLGISDSIPIEKIVNSWEKKYSSLLKKFNLDSSLTTKLFATAIILIVLAISAFISNKVTVKMKNRMRSIAQRLHVDYKKMRFYQRAIYYFILSFILLAVLTALLSTWNISITDYLSEDFITSSLANVVTIYLLILGASVIIDISSGLVEQFFIRWGGSQSRIDTLLPIAKTTVFITFTTLFTLMLLSELGINVMPLLAGAGVLGFAIGFGAQTIIKDLLTGFIIILEDLIQVGDVVKLADRTGVIEKITIRKVQLRDLGGSVYTVPFSEITIVENLTKEYSIALFEVGVAYREDMDHVCTLLAQADKNLREDDNFKHDILEPLEIFGLDKFADSAIIIKARIKTKPSQQWRISREFNRRIKILFDKENIEIPFPHQTIYFGENKDGSAPPLHIAQKDKGENNVHSLPSESENLDQAKDQLNKKDKKQSEHQPHKSTRSAAEVQQLPSKDDEDD